MFLLIPSVLLKKKAFIMDERYVRHQDLKLLCCFHFLSIDLIISFNRTL